MGKRKILIIVPQLPYPLNSGGNQGVYHMIDAIKDVYDVFLWFLSDTYVNKRLINEFKDSLGGKCCVLYTKKKIGINIATMRGLHYKVDKLILRNNLEFRHNLVLWGKETSSRFDNYVLEEIRDIIKKNKIDIVQVEFTALMDYVYILPNSVKKIFIHHELGFARKGSMLNNMIDKCYYDEFHYNRALSREIAALNQYDAVVTLTDVDKEKLIHKGVTTSIQVSPLFIPHKGIFPEFKYAVKRLTYIASGAHYPNVEGLNWFVRGVHPYLVKSVEYTLEVIGGMWDTKQGIDLIPNTVIFKGFINDLTSIIPGSIMIVPILSGSGMRMKILESINNSVPFVSTSIGAEGLDFEDNRDCYIEDNPINFARKIIDLFHHPELQEKFVINSRVLYEKKYSEAVLAKTRLEILNNL